MSLVAVLGAGGTMGRPIAVNLSRAGHAVRAWNRTREKAEPLGADGVAVLGTAAEAAQGADVVLTMLSDGDAVLAAAEGDDGALAGAAGCAIWLQMSTVGTDATERCATLAWDHDVAFVDAPVLGTKQPAEKGELVILASGPDCTQDRLAPVLEPLAKRTLWLGDAGAGTRLKLVLNSWIVAVVEGLAETLALAEGIGVDPRSFFDAIADGPLDLAYARLKGTAMIERDFEPAFKLGLAAKDARLVDETARRHDLDLPLVSTIRARLEDGMAEHGDEDLAATFATSARAPQAAL
jgi:3-hydroxyisobutyrate dehydrogenase